MIRWHWAYPLISALAVFSCGIVFAKDLGSFGRTYTIKERDALEEVEARAKTVNWQKEASRVKPENYRPKDLSSLSRAYKDNVFTVDMTYTLDMDIPDGKGGVIFPRGYAFNPLDHVTFHKTIVVINGEDREQLLWFRSSEYFKRIDVMLLLTEGSYADLKKQLGRPVFYANTQIMDKFGLRFVPSVIRQAGRVMEVREFDVRKTIKKN